MAHRRRGFTLIETVAAIIILAVAVPAMLWAVTEAHQRRANPVMVTTARWLAIEKLEDTIGDRHSLAVGYGALAGGSDTPVPGYPGFNRTTTVTQHGAWDNVTTSWSAGTGYKTITVVVQWTDSDGDTMSLSINTVVTDYTS